MSLNDTLNEIQTEEPGSPSNIEINALLSSIKLLISHVQAHSWTYLGSLKVNPAQLRFLEMLVDNKEVNQKFLSERLNVTFATLSETAKVLEINGFISRRRGNISCLEDRRSQYVSLTSKGIDVLKYLAISHNPLRKAIENLSPNSRNTYFEITQELLTTLEQHTETVRKDKEQKAKQSVKQYHSSLRSDSKQS